MILTVRVIIGSKRKKKERKNCIFCLCCKKVRGAIFVKFSQLQVLETGLQMMCDTETVSAVIKPSSISYHFSKDSLISSPKTYNSDPN
ncbi:UNVERIFIED_CONTAM: hypothetical protein NCL1_11697 [Trichonephila clavipes]